LSFIEYFGTRRRAIAAVVSTLALALAGHTFAESAAFDLVGPQVEVRVKRGLDTLPISEVPNLQAGDRLWIHPDLPDDQSVHHVMVVAFLRGATNPPPDSWFTQVEAWNRPAHEEGVYVTVPEGAQEAIILMAPETGGAFSTLRRAIRGKPGDFPAVPVVVFTAVHSIASKLSVLKAGAYDFLLKPFERDELIFVARRALEYRRLKLENRQYKVRLDELTKREI
jgi:CheY-like chemotaxis protein